MIDDIEQRTANDKLREKIDEDAYMLEIKNIEQAWQEVVKQKEEEIETLRNDVHRLRETLNDLQRTFDRTNMEFSKLQDSNLKTQDAAENMRDKYERAKTEAAGLNQKSMLDLKNYRDELSRLHINRQQEKEHEHCVWKECLKQELAYLQKWALALGSKENSSRRQVLAHLKNIIQRMRDILGCG